MNKFRFIVKQNDTEINIPIKTDFDNVGREDLVREYENDVLEQIINPIEDFETTRFSNKPWLDNQTLRTSLSQNFYFFDRSIDITATTSSNTNLWVSSYNYAAASVAQNYTGITFSDKEKAYSFEKYLKSHSGRAFTSKHF